MAPNGAPGAWAGRSVTLARAPRIHQGRDVEKHIRSIDFTSADEDAPGLPDALRATLDRARGGRAFAAATAFARELMGVPLPLARALARGALAAADEGRELLGFRAGLIDVINVYVPEPPDCLKTAADFRADLRRAWRNLDAADRAEFLRRVAPKAGGQ